MTNTYWNRNGKYEKEAQLLRALIPPSGPVANARSRNKALEKFRKACNCYYDLYNNGLCNRTAEFRTVFGLATSMFGSRGRFDHTLYPATEHKMDEIVKAAAIEQGVMKADLHIVV